MTTLRQYIAVLVVAAFLAGCSRSRSSIFEWVPVDGPVAGSGGSGGGGVGGGAGENAHGGSPADAGAPMAGAGMLGDSGTRPPLDQNVKFDWPEGLPAGGGCRGGVFVGGFVCNVDDAIGTHLDGTIVMDLSGPLESQELEVQSGIATVLVDPAGRVSFNTPVTGKGDCGDRNFTGELPETMFNGEQVGIAFSLVIGLFCAAGNTAKGSLTGRLDPDGLAVNGAISMTIGTCSCRGDFDLRAQR